MLNYPASRHFIICLRNVGYLMAELKKIGFTPSLQTNASAPDPQKINDLQVRHAALILDHNSTRISQGCISQIFKHTSLLFGNKTEHFGHGIRVVIHLKEDWPTLLQ